MFGFGSVGANVEVQVIARAQQDMEDMMFRVLDNDDFKERLRASGCDLTKADENANILADGIMGSWVGDCIRALKAKYPNHPVDCRAAFKAACARVIEKAQKGA